MRHVPIAAVLIVMFAATPTWSDVLLPCGTERIPVREAEIIWLKDSQVFAFCTTMPGVPVAYLDPFKPEEQTTQSISELPEVYFGERLDAANGLVYLKLLIPAELHCQESPPGPYVLVSSMDCKFRMQDPQ